jgi:hypothetical protein
MTKISSKEKALRQAERKGVQSAIGIVFDAMADVAAQDKQWWVVKDDGELIAAGDELSAEATENGKNGTYRTGFWQVFKDRAVAISTARTKTENRIANFKKLLAEAEARLVELQ